MNCDHDWIRDPEQRGEGLICRNCRVTEAEADYWRAEG